MNVRAYLESGGSICPSCGSKDIEGGKSEFDADYCTLEVDCRDCDYGWFDIYKLTGIEERP